MHWQHRQLNLADKQLASNLITSRVVPKDVITIVSKTIVVVPLTKDIDNLR
jgi:hypothetical protein